MSRAGSGAHSGPVGGRCAFAVLGSSVKRTALRDFETPKVKGTMPVFRCGISVDEAKAVGEP